MFPACTGLRYWFTGAVVLGSSLLWYSGDWRNKIDRIQEAVRSLGTEETQKDLKKKKEYFSFSNCGSSYVKLEELGTNE